MDHLYTGLKGHGSFVTTPQRSSPQKLPLSPPLPLPSLRQALIAFEWGSDRRKEIMDMKSRSFVRLCGDGNAEGNQKIEGGQMVQGVRSMGSAALNFCHVASGS